MFLIQRKNWRMTACAAVAVWLWPGYVGAQAVQAPRSFLQRSRVAAIARDVSFTNPPVIQPGKGASTVTLRVVEVVNRFDDIELKHRSYNGDLVGPTIRVRPGQSLRVHLQNDLPAEDAMDHLDNRPHGFNTTNLHVHGVHVSPQSPADNVFLEIVPGAAYDFEFVIPPDHRPGTFWYHAHKHGSTGLQLASGMAGALIVEGGLDEIEEIQAAKEQILVLQQFTYKEQSGEPAIIDADLLYSGEGDIVEAINGVVTPTIVMRPGEVQRWRIIHAGTSEAMFLDAEGVDFYEVAVDGLATGRLEKKNSLQLYPGYRSDVLVQAPREDGIRLVYSKIRDSQKAIQGRATERRNVLRLVVEGSATDMQLPSLAALERVAAFSAADVPRDTEIVERRTLEFSQRENAYFINAKQFDPNEIEASMQLGTAEEWTLSSDSGVHPFHMHVNPFAIRPVMDGDPWIWRDTIVVRRGQPVTIRTHFSRFAGKTVLHCHNLTHEDQGMMRAIEITEGAGPTVGRSECTAPVWAGMEPSGARLSQRDFRDQWLVLVFHRGLDCMHCAAQLKALEAQYPAARQAGLQVVAISEYLPSDADGQSAMEQIPYPLLVDAQRESFRRYGCINERGETLHGVFLVDPRNRLRLALRTETAVADPLAIVFKTVNP